MANFDATIGGLDRFWWANSDGSANTEAYDEPSAAKLCPGSWAPIRFDSLEHGVAVKHWMLLGPFGGPGAEVFNEVLPPAQIGLATEFYEKAEYPPDSHVVNPAEKFSGEQIHGYWGKPESIGWKKVTPADVDVRVIGGLDAQCWYGATWVFSPIAQEVDIVFAGYYVTNIRWYINRDLFANDRWQAYSESDDYKPYYRTLTRTVELQKGWNQISWRAYAPGCPRPFRIGAACPQLFWQKRKKNFGVGARFFERMH